MRFYTNVQLIGNQLLVRGVENGRRYEHRDEFFPTLFVKSKRNSKYRTLSGEPVEEVHPGTVRDCREFYKKYDGVMELKMVGGMSTEMSSFLPCLLSLRGIQSIEH